MNEVLVPVLILAGIALFAGVLLTIASKYFIKTMKLSMALQVLPMANCGACGYAGCNMQLLLQGKFFKSCKPGGSEAATKISEIIGSEVKRVA